MAKTKRKTGQRKPEDKSKIIHAPKVEVGWVDATSHSGWMEVAEMREKAAVLMHTVGYLIERTKKHVKLVRSREDTGFAVGDVFIIPTDWVNRVKRLK